MPERHVYSQSLTGQSCRSVMILTDFAARGPHKLIEPANLREAGPYQLRSQ